MVDTIQQLCEVCETLADMTEVYDTVEISAFEYDSGYYGCKKEYKLEADTFDTYLLVIRTKQLEENKDV